MVPFPANRSKASGRKKANDLETSVDRELLWRKRLKMLSGRRKLLIDKLKEEKRSPGKKAETSASGF